jgi:ubiquinone/menaquinone biosynthesis C-methylase UbiE
MDQRRLLWRFQALGAKKRRSQWMLDLRYPLPCACNYWDGIFIEHTLEHLQPIDVLSLLRECYRVLKPNSWIRVVVPDLEKYVEYYVTGLPSHDNFGRWQTGAEAIRSLTQNWGHRSVWDGKLMSQILQEAGFDNARKAAFGQGTDAEIIKDSPSRSWESLYVEARAIEVVGKSST